MLGTVSVAVWFKVTAFGLSLRIMAMNGINNNGVNPPIKNKVCHLISGNKMARLVTKIAPTGNPQY